MSIVLDILRSYRAPREVVRRRIGDVQREDRALAVLLAGCFVVFIAQWPRLSREAFLDQAIPLDARLAGAFFGWLFLAPLALYVIALLIRGGMGLLGIPATGYDVRVTLFWALLAASPMWLLSGLMAGFVGPSKATSIVGLLAFASFFAIWLAGLAEIKNSARKQEDYQ